MSYTMVHLLIAYKILEISPEIQNPSAFMLGSIAPDAVHFRNNYRSDMKKASHLCVGKERWGEITENAAWLESALAYLSNPGQNMDPDFLRGYCTHILTDIQNNIKIWASFRADHSQELHEAYPIYAQEALFVDRAINGKCQHFAEIRRLLHDAVAMDVPSCISKNELEQMRAQVLTDNHPSPSHEELDTNRYVRYDRMHRFIQEESEYIHHLLTLHTSNR